MVQRYGVDAVTGKLSPCRARPENRGRGRCNHADHVESDMNPKELRDHNEKVLAEYFSKLEEKSAHEEYPWVRSGMVQSCGTGEPLSHEQFKESVRDLSEAFPNEEWSYIKNITIDIDAIVTDPEMRQHFNNAEEAVYNYLMSDSPTAIQTRKFLGPDVDLKTFSHIMATSVGAMQSPTPWKPTEQLGVIRRGFATTVGNDMTKQRYIASVLYFGGRCCYCNKTMNNIPHDPQQATGEHITPLNPDNPNSPVGGTRFGNMALACRGCNSARMNKDLEEWVETTDRIPEDSKNACLNRLKKFREFALYEEYTPQQSAIIRRNESIMSEEITKVRSSGRRQLDEISRKHIKDIFAIVVHETNEAIRR